MEGIFHSSEFELQLIVTGTHLSPEFGMTVDAIEADGFKIDCKVEMLLSSHTAVGITKSMGLGMISFADALARLKPDLVLILGDRYEIFAAAASAMIAGVPIAHVHGGEVTQGAFDEAIRHSITKMSHLHFVAAEEYRRRVVQLGEQPKLVFNVGGLGVDNIKRLKLLDRDELEAALNFRLEKRNLLITFHPVTLEPDTLGQQMDELLAALAALKDTGLVFTMPNADTNGRLIFDKINAFCAKHSKARAFVSLGQLRYLSCIKHFDGVVGNSSSGLMEVPSFKKGTVNIGDRQAGRLRSESVIDCEPEHKSIGKAISQLYTPSFQATLQRVVNPYGNGGASEAILAILKKQSFESLLKKPFFDWS
jgi:GDP/UDP-N,N'-diacetylbacillosamine 2-epimerase (hydrolysing)